MTTIAIIGGTGFAGAAIAAEAARRGYQVTALSRSTPEKPIDGVTYVQGDAQTSAAEVVDGADVIIGALSPRAGSEGTLVDTYANLAELAAKNDARLIVIGGFGSLRPAPGAPRFSEGDGMPPEILPEAREMKAVLDVLTATPKSLSWTFVSPGAEFGGHLPQTEPRGTYRTGGDVALFDADGKSAIGGADFATAVVDEIEAAAHPREHISFAY